LANHGQSSDGDAFERLLAALDADRTRAGERYVLLRERLVKFFEWRGVANPEDAADAALDVLSRRLLEGETIRNVAAYVHGIARMVLLSRRREEELRRDVHRQAAALAAPDNADPDRDRRLTCLERCLQQLPLESRTLLFRYYVAGGSKRISVRKALAAGLGIELNALRIRVHRLRVKLEDDVMRCVNGARSR
jgi:DNA-directed RNA polymerase specialized sigma24 family protein